MIRGSYLVDSSLLVLKTINIEKGVLCKKAPAME